MTSSRRPRPAKPPRRPTEAARDAGTTEPAGARARRNSRPAKDRRGLGDPPSDIGRAGKGRAAKLPADPDGPLRLRIVGGTFRGRVLQYHGDQRVRPMKDRTREAVFNLLGPRVAGSYAWDLFSGTGAMGLEAISRGAVGATLIERHIPTSKLIRDNVESLSVQARVRIVQADAFHWMRKPVLPAELATAQAAPWVIFCCPPYALYRERLADFERLVNDLDRAAPPGSVLVVEAEIPFDVAQLKDADWQVREYAPAVVGIVTIGDARDAADDPVEGGAELDAAT